MPDCYGKNGLRDIAARFVPGIATTRDPPSVSSRPIAVTVRWPVAVSTEMRPSRPERA